MRGEKASVQVPASHAGTLQLEREGEGEGEGEEEEEGEGEGEGEGERATQRASERASERERETLLGTMSMTGSPRRGPVTDVAAKIDVAWGSTLPGIGDGKTLCVCAPQLPGRGGGFGKVQGSPLWTWFPNNVSFLSFSLSPSLSPSLPLSL